MMVKIPDEVIERVQSQTDIADVVGQYVQLSQSGKNLFGLCPFHEERTPSFSVSEDKQIFHCFSCGRGGNVFKFLMELQDLSFKEAVQKVAEFSNIALSDEYFATTAQQTTNNSEANQLIQIHEEAVSLYHHILVNTKLGKPALTYLKQRGLTDQTIADFKLGFAPANRLLTPFFKEKDFDYQLLRKSGLFVDGADGQINDRFVDRIMYPIRDSNGKTVAFSGRLLTTNPEAPKYLNSPETTIFKKSKILFNLDRARSAIRNNQPAILLEGFMDVISATQAGITSTVASMGTSLTDEQAYDLKRITNSIVIAYDGDDAGQSAINRSLDTLAKQSFTDLKIVNFPQNQDPDEFIKQSGAEAFQKLIETAFDVTDFKLRYLKRDFNLNSKDEQTAYLNQALQVVARIGSDVKRDLYVTDLANEFQISKAILVSQLAPFIKSNAKTLSNGISSANQSINAKPTTPAPVFTTAVQKAEASLLKRMLTVKDVWVKIMGMADFHFANEQCQMLYLLAQQYFTEHDDYEIATFSSMIMENSLQSLLINIDEVDLDDDCSEQEIDDYLRVIKTYPITAKLNSKKQELTEAVKIGDVSLQRQLMMEIIKLEQEKRINRYNQEAN